MSKFFIENTNKVVNMSKQETIDVFTGICNQLEGYEKSELFLELLARMNKRSIEEVLNFCCARFSYQANISLVENGIIEEN